MTRGLLRCVGLGALALTALGCSAVYPEMGTRVRAPVADEALEPAPPTDLYYIAFEGAIIPNHTQDGREWSGGGPDPYAKLKVGERDLIVTPTQSSTRRPSWPDQTQANYRLEPGAELTVEMWDARAGTDHPICVTRVLDIDHIRDGGNNELQCDSGARVFLTVQPARPVLGIGLFYELRGTDGVRVTRVVSESPAARAGLKPGDRILAIQGTPVGDLDALGVRGKINGNTRTGLMLDVLFVDGKHGAVELEEGPIYPVSGDGVSLPVQPSAK